MADQTPSLAEIERELQKTLTAKREEALELRARAGRYSLVSAIAITAAAALGIAAALAGPPALVLAGGIAAALAGSTGLWAGYANISVGRNHARAEEDIRELLEAERMLKDPGKRYLVEHGLGGASGLMNPLAHPKTGEAPSWAQKLNKETPESSRQSPTV